MCVRERVCERKRERERERERGREREEDDVFKRLEEIHVLCLRLMEKLM